MSGQYRQPIVILNEQISARSKVKSTDIPRMVSEIIGPNVNCYPGKPSLACYSTAVFISMKVKAKGRGHLTCRQALEKMVQHMIGMCCGYSKVAIFFCDEWNANAFNEWESVIKKIRETCLIEFYLSAGNTVSRIEV